MFESGLHVETAIQSSPQSDGKNPMEPRWGINCAVRDKPIEGSKVSIEQFGTGQISSSLPFGVFFKVAHFPTREEFHSTDDDPNLPRERNVTKSAESAELYLDSLLGGKTLLGHRDPLKQDEGIRFAFYGEEDMAKMRVISATLLPSLEEIRQIADNYGLLSPIGDHCDGEDTVDFGERQSCPSCWLKWIDSAACSRFVNEVAINGREVTVTDVNSGRQTRSLLTPSLTEFETARGVIMESLQHGLAANERLWTTVARELENKKRDAIDDYQDNIRKDVHAHKPQDAQMAQIANFAKAMGANQQPMIVSNDPTAGMTTAEKAAYYQDLAEFEEFRAAKQVSQNLGSSDAASESFTVGQPVLCDGLPGVIAEVKAGGWFDVTMDGSTEPKTVRKDKLQSRGN